MAKPVVQIKIDAIDERVLIFTPTGRDASLTQKIFTEMGFTSAICKSMKEFCLEMGNGAGAALMTEEALTPQAIKSLIQCLDQQPAWSDIPIILFAANSESAGVLLNRLGNKSIL